MKKRMSWILLICVTFGLCACGPKEEIPVETESTEVIEVNTSIDPNIPVPTELSMQELYEMDLSVFKEMVEAYLPNYRDVYKIDAGMELTDSDWERIKELLGYQLWGEDYLWFVSDTVEKEQQEIEYEENTDPNAIYYNPTAEYIEKMSTKEYAEYLDQMMYYFAGSSTEEQAAISKDFSFTLLTDEKIEELRAQQLEEIRSLEEE